LGNFLRWPIFRSDQADGCPPTEIVVSEGACTPRRLGCIPLAVRLRLQAPHDFGLRPAVRMPQAAVAKPVTARLLLERPGAVPPQRPVPDLSTHAPPRVCDVASTTDKARGFLI